MENSISYAVVRFVDQNHSKLMVELVSISWILEFEDFIQCRWSPSHLNKYIQKWIKEAKPSEIWSKYNIEILTTTGKLFNTIFYSNPCSIFQSVKLIIVSFR